MGPYRQGLGLLVGRLRLPALSAPIAEPERPDIQALDALFADRQQAWWDGFYADRSKPVPFFASVPDECLLEWLREAEPVPQGAQALDLGCGNGRNAIALARAGYAVRAIDYSPAAIAWAAEAAQQAGVALQLEQASVFDLAPPLQGVDLIYDSGCFHHLAPHRRADYVHWVSAALKPGGCFGLVCFRPEGGSGLSDAEVYERRSLGGGLGYAKAQLREIWGQDALQIEVLRPMRECSPQTQGCFGTSFLWALRARKR